MYVAHTRPPPDQHMNRICTLHTDYLDYLLTKSANSRRTWSDMGGQVCSKTYIPHSISRRDRADQDQNTDSALIDRFSACSARPGSPEGMCASDM